MTHIMLDLETLGTGNDAVVTAIGACVFDPRASGGGTHLFYRNVGNWTTQQTKGGRQIDGDTIAWWFEQSDSARLPLLVNQCKPETALHDFAEILEGLDVELWGNGADFDNIILGNMYKGYSIKRPWSYSRNRCFRTMKNLSLPKTFVKPVFSGTKHNALDDAVHQAEYLQAIYKALNL